MQYWILKGKRKSEFGFENDFASMVRRGKNATWFSGKLLDAIAPGDRLFVYEGSPKFQVWGLARYLRRVDAGSFEIRYETHALQSRVTRDGSGMNDEPCFAGATFLKSGPVQTIYKLTEVQASWLYAAVVRAEPALGGTWETALQVQRRSRIAGRSTGRHVPFRAQ